MDLGNRLTIKQASARTGYRPYTLLKYAELGKIPAEKIGRDWFLLEADVLAYREEKPQRKPRKVAVNE